MYLRRYEKGRKGAKGKEEELFCIQKKSEKLAPDVALRYPS